MSQLSSLNQAQQTQSSAQVSDLQATKNKVVKAELNIANNLQGTFKLQGLTNPITQQLTIAQANQLKLQPLLALMNQQSALIFLQSKQVIQSLNLPPALLSMAQEWLKADKNLSNKLPKELASFLSGKLALKPELLQSQIVNATLKQSLLQLSFVQGEALAELRLSTATTQAANEQLEQLLQFMLPIAADDDASVLMQQLPTSEEEADDGTMRFKLQFNLDKLGKLEVQVELNEFVLTTVCTCDSVLLQQKVERYWPQLASRLSSLGFDVSNQIKQKTRIDGNTSQHKPSSLINIKV